MIRKIIYITITLIAFNIFAGFNIQRIPRWFKAQWDYYAEKYISASENYEKASSGESDSVMQYNQGSAEYKDGNYEEAEELFTKAVESDPEFEEAHYNQGNSRFFNDDLEGAVESYENALEIDPEDEDARHNLEYVKKLLEQKNSTNDNADPQEDQHRQNPQSSDRESDEERNERPEDKLKGEKDDQKNSEEQGEAFGGEEPEENQEETDGGGGGSEKETEEEPPADMAQGNQNTSGLSDQMIEQLLEALAQDEKALAGMLEQRKNEESDMFSDPFGMFNDMWSVREDLESFVTRKQKKRPKDEVDW